MNLSEIQVTTLKEIPTAGGNVLHGLKNSDPSFFGFGEAYFSWIEAGAIKAWKRHNQMIMNLIVPIGNVKFVFYNSDSEEFVSETIGESNYSRITVPTGIWFGFQGIDSPKNLVLNISSILHDPLEADRLDLSKINYSW
ncbi:dTDP-4-dehydrorhamnose 3,5-epimerase [Leptospira perdikensis]|uniref:dTDP-4-dehydrorhamnose 3,5-epimerase n=1 Tax=Leptospira perdikensis TaxID=2484948 RepID=A0A4R9JNH1_9LEPT|nr:dTDP-4-dehydrorhamnose 3,5-epimerase [Leptospira perdikensis]TGL45985.1 dTDP-4-dehydrorhamnose 3,5-epimerase [Leptospira perdikensis]